MLTISPLEAVLHGYIDHQDGTILDLKTNLIWQQEGPKKKYTWQEAKEHCERLRFGGYNDWRLPTKEELMSLIDKRHRPTICPIFQCYEAFYWSSTSYAGRPIYAWFVNFHSGLVYSNGVKDNAFYVRAVRSGP